MSDYEETKADPEPLPDTSSTDMGEDRPEPGETDALATRRDQGPERWEDKMTPGQEDPAPLSAEEVDPEEARKDETTVLATDIFDSEGNRLE